MFQNTSAISHEEEKELFNKYFTETNQAAKISIRNKIVEQHLWLVRVHSKKYHGVTDVPNEGVLGLICAVDKFDPSREFRFSTYAAWWVRCYIQKYLFENRKMVRLPIHQKTKKLFYNLSKVSAALLKEGKEVTSEAIAMRLNVSVEDVEQIRIYFYEEKSMEAPVGSDNELTFGGSISSDATLPDEAYSSADESLRLAEAYNEFRTTLNPRQLQVFNECFLDDKGYAELGKEVGISRERVRQIAGIVQDKFRAFCLRKGLTEMLSSGTVNNMKSA